MARSRQSWGLFFTFALLGFLLITQLNTQGNLSPALEEQSLDELTTLVGALSRETDRLRQEQVELKVRLNSYRYQEESARSRLTARERTLEDLLVATGSVAGEGRGIEVQVEDEHGALGAYDMTTLVNELRSSGAEAIAVDGRRVTYDTGFADQDDGVLMDDAPLSRPYVFTAVGDPDDLRSGLVMAGGVIAMLETMPGVAVSVDKEDALTVPARGDPPDFERAVPVEKRP